MCKEHITDIQTRNRKATYAVEEIARLRRLQSEYLRYVGSTGGAKISVYFNGRYYDIGEIFVNQNGPIDKIIEREIERQQEVLDNLNIERV